MKRIEALFLLSVFITAGVFALMSVSQAVRLLPSPNASEGVNVDAAGQARDVDMEKLQRMLRQGRLSRREAEYYREYRPTAPGGSDPLTNTGGGSQTGSASPTSGVPNSDAASPSDDRP